MLCTILTLRHLLYYTTTTTTTTITTTKPELVQALTLDQWLIKLTSDGAFFSLFLTSLVEHVTSMTEGNDVVGGTYNNDVVTGGSSNEDYDDDDDGDSSSIRRRRAGSGGSNDSTTSTSSSSSSSSFTGSSKGSTIVWDTIPAYWLCIKLYMCLLRQTYVDKLITFSKNNGSGFSSFRYTSLKTASPKAALPGTTVSIFRFKIEGPRAFNAIVKTGTFMSQITIPGIHNTDKLYLFF